MNDTTISDGLIQLFHDIVFRIMTLITNLYALAGVIIISTISLVGVLTIALNEKILRRLVFVFVSVSVGALIGDAFIHLLPEAAEHNISSGDIAIFVFLGILTFFILEKFLLWRHTHAEGAVGGGEGAGKTAMPLSTIILVGDGVHNLIDGVIIGTSFSVSFEVGLATLFAIALREIPQEIGDFSLLIHAGFSNKKALIYNYISGLVAVV